MSGVSKRKFLYFKLYINNLSNSRKTVRTPTNITTGTNILKLDPGIYSYEDSNASDEQKLAMGFPKAMWHSEITVTGYWADNNKSTGYINIVVRDCNSNTPCIYENLYSWTGWRGWQSYALKSDLPNMFSSTVPTDWTNINNDNAPLSIWNVGTTGVWYKGAPKGAYRYGTLIFLGGNNNKGDWRNVLIYIPDMGSEKFIYVRNERSSTWLKLSGTTVDSVT